MYHLAVMPEKCSNFLSLGLAFHRFYALFSTFCFLFSSRTRLRKIRVWTIHPIISSKSNTLLHGLREIFCSNGNKIFESRVLFLQFTIVVKMKLHMFIIHNTRNPKSRIIVTYNDKRGYNPCLLFSSLI